MDEPEFIQKFFKLEVEFTNQSPTGVFKPISTRRQAELQLQSLSSRVDVSKVTLTPFILAADGTEIEVQ